MGNGLIGLVGVILVVLIAESVGICLRRPLGVLLRAEKGTDRSEFWSAYTRVVFLLVPAAFALMGFPDSPLREPLLVLIDQLRWGIAGLLIALAVAGKALRGPARPTHAPYVPPIHPPAVSGPAR